MFMSFTLMDFSRIKSRIVLISGSYDAYKEFAWTRARRWNIQLMAGNLPIYNFAFKEKEIDNLKQITFHHHCIIVVSLHEPNIVTWDLMSDIHASTGWTAAPQMQ